MSRQGLDAASGVVLSRSVAGEGDLLLALFLKGRGLVRVSARGAAGGRVRFGGGTEPLVWGAFRLHRGRGGGAYLSAVDVVDGMIPLRRRPEALRTAVRWSKLLLRHLMAEHPADDLLANLYWNMRLLGTSRVPPEAAEWRFLWRWITVWGLAPDLTRCARCGRLAESLFWTGEGLTCAGCGPGAGRPRFSGEDLSLLRRTAGADVHGVERYGELGELDGARGLFALASRCVGGLLSQDIRDIGFRR